jgi:putative ABC transport system substrate-binding protein
MEQLSRRRFMQWSLALAGLGLLSGCGVPVPWAQPGPRTYRIGWLAFGDPVGMAPLIGALREGLRQLGYEEGRNLVIEERWAERRQERLDALAAELVHLAPDVIVSQATPASLAAKKATATIPIVAVSISDPVGSGLVDSLARPGGNVTGLGLSPPSLTTKRLELLKETAPLISRVAFLWNPDNPVDGSALAEARAVAPALGLTLVPLEVRAAADFPPALQEAADRRADGGIFLAGALSGCCMPQIVEFMLRERVPAVHDTRITGPDAGGLMSYGPSSTANYRYAATLVDKIFRGARPADLPVEQPSAIEFVINRKTADALGLWPLPESVLQQATELIP